MTLARLVTSRPLFGPYFAEANPSAHENSRNSSFGGTAFRYVRTDWKGSISAFGSMLVI